MLKRPLAVVTMSYNERALLPIWTRHYGRQVGAENCFVLDNGSDDGSTDEIAATVVKLPRAPFLEIERSASVADFCSSLLYYYDHVLFCDTDELVVADPNVAADLQAYARLDDLPDAVTPFGMDLVHVEEEEAALDPQRPILAQRKWVRPAGALCKPTFIKKRCRWGPGCHFKFDDTPVMQPASQRKRLGLFGKRPAPPPAGGPSIARSAPVFRDLYRFHVAYADIDILRERQAKRNTAPPADGSGAHHLLHPEIMVSHIRTRYVLEGRDKVELGGCRLMSEFIASLAENRFAQTSRLWELPERFRTLF